MGLLVPAYGDRGRRISNSKLVLTTWQDPVSKSKMGTDVDGCGRFSEWATAVSTPNTPPSSETSKKVWPRCLCPRLSQGAVSTSGVSSSRGKKLKSRVRGLSQGLVPVPGADVRPQPHPADAIGAVFSHEAVWVYPVWPVLPHKACCHLYFPQPTTVSKL